MGRLRRGRETARWGTVYWDDIGVIKLYLAMEEPPKEGIIYLDNREMYRSLCHLQLRKLTIARCNQTVFESRSHYVFYCGEYGRCADVDVAY